jgi:GPH family glycoside/pentoside/hexuronide:cation symporter
VPFAAKALGFTDTTELNLQTLALTAVLVLVCVPLINLYSLARVPNGEATAPAPPAGNTGNWRELLRAMAGNGPLLRLLGACVPVFLLNGVSAGTTFLYVDVYLHLGKELPLIQLVGLPLTLLGMPFWGWLCQRFERHRVWAVSLIAAAICYGAMAFAPVGKTGLYLILTLYPITLFCVVCMFIAVPAMIGDIVDEDRLRTGEDRSGVYSAIYVFLSKSLVTVAGACGIALAGWFGFDATASQQGAWGAFGIKLVTVGLPALGFALTAPLIWWFPIDRARQKEIREAMRALETPDAGSLPLNTVGGQRDAAQA